MAWPALAKLDASPQIPCRLQAESELTVGTPNTCQYDCSWRIGFAVCANEGSCLKLVQVAVRILDMLVTFDWVHFPRHATHHCPTRILGQLRRVIPDPTPIQTVPDCAPWP